MARIVIESRYATFKSYFNEPRLGWVLLFGISSGLPWVLIGSALSGWLKDAGLSRANIGYIGVVFVVYSINALWSPFLDRVKLPFIYKRLGMRRSWIVLMQFIILLTCLCIAFTNPATHYAWTMFLALIIAIASATQDIAIDAFRIDSFTLEEIDRLPQASAMATIGWWTGYSIPGFIAFDFADKIGWGAVYLVMAALLALLICGTLFIAKEPITHREQLQQELKKNYNLENKSWWTQWLFMTFIMPFADFFKRNGVRVALTLLCFVFLFKIGEAFLGRMSIVFYREVGFSNVDIAHYSKLIGWGLTVCFTLTSSFINIRFGVVKGLFIGGIAMASSNLMYALMAHIGPDKNFYLITLLVDNFTTSFSTVATVSFFSLLTGRAFSATQYALLSSLASLGRTTLSSFSGSLVDYLNYLSLTKISSPDLAHALPMMIAPASNTLLRSMSMDSWRLFFVITTLMVIPSLILLLTLWNHLKKLQNDK